MTMKIENSKYLDFHNPELWTCEKDLRLIDEKEII